MAVLHTAQPEQRVRNNPQHCRGAARTARAWLPGIPAAAAHLRLPRVPWLCMDMCAWLVGVWGAAVLALATLAACRCSACCMLGPHSTPKQSHPNGISTRIAGRQRQ